MNRCPSFGFHCLTTFTTPIVYHTHTVCPVRRFSLFTPHTTTVNIPMTSTRSSKKRAEEQTNNGNGNDQVYTAPSPSPMKEVTGGGRRTTKRTIPSTVSSGVTKTNKNRKPSKKASVKGNSESTANGMAQEEQYRDQNNKERYFLMKSEPESRIQDGHEMKYSIDDLEQEENQTTWWDGVRNYEARNIMKEMKIGDQAFFYHSNTKRTRPSIVGQVEVVKECYADHTAFDKNDPHFDAKSDKEKPRWLMVDVKLVKKFDHCVSLDEIKECEDLKDMQLVKRGRISVQRVTADEWQTVLQLAGECECVEPQ